MIEDKIKEGRLTLGKLGVYLSATTEGGRKLEFNLIEFPELQTIGINNITQDFYFVLFMDFDRISRDQLMGQLEYLSKIYGCSHFLVLTTGEKRFHAICFEKYKFEEITKILNDSLCDYAFKMVPQRTDKGWILRVRPKLNHDGIMVKDRPLFETFVAYGEPKRKMSRAHLEFFGLLYPGFRDVFKSAVMDEKYWDDNTSLNVIKYGTSNKDLLANFDFGSLENSKNISIKWTEEKD